MTKQIDMDQQLVYRFGGGSADGSQAMKNLLGGKGANLAEMAGHPDLQLPVPPGFTITTDTCNAYYEAGRQFPAQLEAEVMGALERIEQLTGKVYGNIKNPLLLSVRSGARQSMPGMMDTVLNLGLNDETVQGLIAQTNDPRFAYDAYRRLIMMYADVVMEKAAGIPPVQGKGIRKLLDEHLESVKKARGFQLDTELTEADLRQIVTDFKAIIKREIGESFPDDPMAQLWGGVSAVFDSWNGKRAKEYRRIEKLPDEWGTAVNVQAMVFGNMGEDCATGVAFTRNPGTGENQFYGEFLINAQGEDIVAGTRTPQPINAYSKNTQSENLPTLESLMPEIYAQLNAHQQQLEGHYKDMQDLEFTFEKGTLYILQTRTGKRNGTAAVRMAAEMYQEGMIDAPTALLRVNPNQLTELLLPRLDAKAESAATPIAKGLPAGPGGAKGKVVFSSEKAVEWKRAGEAVILVREETSPEDVEGMFHAAAVLTAKGGMTSHAALVTRGWGKCCIVGCHDLEISEAEGHFLTPDGQQVKEGDWISLNGASGDVYLGKMPVVDADLADNEDYQTLMGLVEKTKTLGVRANAESPIDAANALRFGAEGIGLFRTEHMFYGKGSEKPLSLLRKMILSDTRKDRRTALNELFSYIKSDIKETLSVMKGKPVTVRLLDPPLHEFVPHDAQRLEELADELGVKVSVLEKRVLALHESNPMLGHRGVRLGISYPEITETQVRAILEAAAELNLEGVEALPEIMIPVTCSRNELQHQEKIVKCIYQEVCTAMGVEEIPYLFGTMIETPRAALRSGPMAEIAQFFSFGTNDLTQLSFGFSRDDIGGFLPIYLRKGILAADPFQVLDRRGVGELVRLAVERGRAQRPGLKTGICGEHGGEPQSVEFCHRIGLDYVSCSPFRVPVARLAAAQAAIKYPRK
ncbi:MAG: pyruvate, phosphate dikinase [Phaeodactylibacter sp.]|uniref:pyruvate, phosphate dikinase n=1 Tax=Phaeodactylibacter sp. TaxID=1940289 RepID=UPI0032EE0D93